jgi:hypothetical protein
MSLTSKMMNYNILSFNCLVVMLRDCCQTALFELLPVHSAKSVADGTQPSSYFGGGQIN